MANGKTLAGISPVATETERNYKERNYQRHREVFGQYLENSEKKGIVDSWLVKQTVDSWRHLRMYQAVDPILNGDPNAHWLTVGDGRFGLDAQYLIKGGAQAMATDIFGNLLEEARDKGLIQDCQTENAESLSFPDAHFDYVFCKESYHHFPRPTVALYEMLRVARKAVVLIEPNDQFSGERGNSIARTLMGLARTILRRGKPMRNNFERESGNYIYSISRREMEKIAIAAECRAISFKGVNDAYVEGAEAEKLAAKGCKYRKISSKITLADIACQLGLSDYGLLCLVIFKREPVPNLVEKLVRHGYEHFVLPHNPFIEKLI